MKKFGVVVLALLALSACKVRYEIGTVVDGDGSGTLSIAIAFDEEFRQLLSGEFLGGLGESFGGELETPEAPQDPIEDLLDDVPEGWEAERFEDGDLQGVRATRGFESVEELNQLVAESDRFGDDLGEGADPSGDSGGPDAEFADGYSLTREGDVFSFRFEPAAAGIDELGNVGEGAEDFFGGEESPFEFEVLLRITLPGKILEHNADQKDGNELVWRMTPTDTQTAAARSDAGQSEGSGFPWWVLGVGLIVIVAAVAVAVGAGRRRSEPQAVGETSGAPPPPPEAGGAPPPPPPPPPG